MRNNGLLRDFLALKDCVYVGTGLYAGIVTYPLIMEKLKYVQDLEEIIRKMDKLDFAFIAGSFLFARGIYNLAVKYRQTEKNR